MRHDRHYVDELAHRMGEGIGRMIRVTSITSNLDQPRTNLGDLGDLVASIERYGVLEPLLVRKTNGGYQLVSGERRLHAAMHAGLTELPCIELAVTDQHALEIALIENLQRKDLNAFEEAEGFVTLVDKYHYTHDQVAEAVGRSRVTITETLKLLAIPAALREACRHADIRAKGILLEIAKAGSRANMERLIQEIIDHRLDRDAIRDRRKQLASGRGGPDPSALETQRPYVLRFKNDDRTFSMSLSFRTEREPDPEQVIRALEKVIQELREKLEQPE
jgi:ParB family chromosome partitioning protein